MLDIVQDDFQNALLQKSYKMTLFLNQRVVRKDKVQKSAGTHHFSPSFLRGSIEVGFGRCSFWKWWWCSASNMPSRSDNRSSVITSFSSEALHINAATSLILAEFKSSKAQPCLKRSFKSVSALNDNDGTNGLLHRLDPSSISSSNLTHLQKKSLT